jgi:hypothetical protein
MFMKLDEKRKVMVIHDLSSGKEAGKKTHYTALSACQCRPMEARGPFSFGRNSMLFS